MLSRECDRCDGRIGAYASAPYFQIGSQPVHLQDDNYLWDLCTACYSDMLGWLRKPPGTLAGAVTGLSGPTWAAGVPVPGEPRPDDEMEVPSA